ncbi:MAG: hypothetical protein WC785_02805 [Tatlockia sp.]|jgi:hypothetical protein
MTLKFFGGTKQGFVVKNSLFQTQVASAELHYKTLVNSNQFSTRSTTNPFKHSDGLIKQSSSSFEKNASNPFLPALDERIESVGNKSGFFKSPFPQKSTPQIKTIQTCIDQILNDDWDVLKSIHPRLVRYAIHIISALNLLIECKNEKAAPSPDLLEQFHNTAIKVDSILGDIKDKGFTEKQKSAIKNLMEAVKCFWEDADVVNRETFGKYFGM